MNVSIAVRKRFLKLRQRADRYELETMDVRDELAEALDRINEMARERGAAEAEMIRRHTTELAKARGDSTDVRQKIQGLENQIVRALEALEHLDPSAARVAPWSEVIKRLDLWYAWRSNALGIELHSDTQAATSVRHAPGGTGGVAYGGGGTGLGGSNVSDSASFERAPKLSRWVSAWPDEK